jgi:hypothetical protein
MVHREPAGLPEAFPHQDLLVVDALERAGSASHCCHRDHHFLLVPFGLSGLDAFRLALRHSAAHEADAVLLMAFFLRQPLRPV